MRCNVLNRFGRLAVVALLAGFASLLATTINYTGTLPNPNALFEVRYTLTVMSTVTISTSGVPGAGGNFFPVLWLFNSTDTTQLDKNDPPANSDASMTETNQAPGTYDVILSAFDQHYCVANTNCNSVFYGNTGWSYNGNFFGRSPNFNVTITSGASLTDNTNSCSTTPNNCINPSPTRAFPSVPEPASAGLLLAGGAVLGWLRFRRSRKVV